MVDPIRVLLADKERLIHDTVRLAIEDDERLLLVGELTGANDLQIICPKLQPDILLLATNVTEKPLTLLETIHRHCPKLKTLILFSDTNDVNIALSNHESINGALLKFEPPERLIDAIHTIVQGDPWFSPSLLKKMLHQQRLIANTPLTTQERKLLRLLVAEKKDQEIAQALNVSTRTVHNYLQNVYYKLGVNTRVAAVYQATKRNII
ncbi:MAG: hypothetical protein CSB13_11370 [Chloroflexi bacterium]|nr:MAG: hypothetical protein CSB13_11370 [Chloroflexota bacterium]